MPETINDDSSDLTTAALVDLRSGAKDALEARNKPGGAAAAEASLVARVITAIKHGIGPKAIKHQIKEGEKNAS